MDARERSQMAAASLSHPLTRSLLALTFSTGLIDAASYLGLGRVFSANMTGNIVFLGFGIAGGDHLPVLAPLVALAAFVVGSGIGGAHARRFANRHDIHVGGALAAEALLLAAATVLSLAVTIRVGAVSGDGVIALLALAMGIRNATVRRLAVPDLTTTVLTLTITGLAAEISKRKLGKGSVRRIAAILSMLTGALAGALLLKISLTLVLALAAALALVTCVAYVPSARREV
jgi:uncharacterized membrane protein YoaK (UPF0700 family)